MKCLKKAMCLLLLVALTVTTFAPLAVSAETGEGTANIDRRKIVSVVYDNSGSMKDHLRQESAKYALEMLISLLDQQDEMIVVPMNNGLSGSENLDPALNVYVDLSASNRDAECDRVVDLPYLMANGGTPYTAMGLAVDELVKRGLKDSANQWDNDPDVEHWLIILTDGAFNNTGSIGSLTDAQKIEHYIKDYPSLRTVYLALGNGAEDMSEGESAKTLSPYQVKAFSADTKKLASTMQSVANLLSGRHPLDPSYYTVSGDTLTIDVSKLDYSLMSVSVIAQNCGATVSSANYGGKSLKIEDPCIFVPDTALSMKDGFSCSVRDDQYFTDGQLTVHFSVAVAPENITVLVEPALRLEYYLECKEGDSWKRVDRQYVNEHLRAGDSIRVGYEIVENDTGIVIDREKVFQSAEGEILYVGKTYGIGEEIPVAVGSHDLAITVSVLDDAYVLRANCLCTVEENPSYYRVEVVDADSSFDPNTCKAEAVYAVYVDNRPATYEMLKNDYTISAEAVSSAGQRAQIQTKLQADGRIHADLSVPKEQFDNYHVVLTVESPFHIRRMGEHDIGYYPQTLDVSVSGVDKITCSQYGIQHNDGVFRFTLTADGDPLPFTNGLIRYRLTVGGADVTEYTSLEEGYLVWCPGAEQITELVKTSADHEVLLKVECLGNSALNDSATAVLSIVDTAYEVIAMEGGERTLDRFHLDDTPVTLYYTILRDGDPLPAEELNALLAAGEITVTGKKFGLFNLPVLTPTALRTDVETVNGTAAIAVHVERDWAKWFYHYPSMFVRNGDKPVTVSYLDLEATANAVYAPSGVFAYVWRVIVILLFIHVCLYLIGFASSKKLPRAAVLYGVASERAKLGIKYVNSSAGALVLWHLLRLIPCYGWIATRNVPDFPTWKKFFPWYDQPLPPELKSRWLGSMRLFAVHGKKYEKFGYTGVKSSKDESANTNIPVRAIDLKTASEAVVRQKIREALKKRQRQVIFEESFEDLFETNSTDSCNRVFYTDGTWYAYYQQIDGIEQVTQFLGFCNLP
ncbi:MAG: hypothetical protein IJW99_06280 [Clostridia bacterium]|nr:hypothetical protein [Clostridia bacterium]